MWIASIFSYVGSWAQDVGQSWLMVTTTQSPVLVAMLTTAFTVPCIALALPAGVLADRADRRKILAWSQGAMALFAMLLAIATWAGRASPAILLAESALLGVATAVTSPPWQSLVPELGGRRHLTEAITLNSIAFNIARAVGPALGGLVLGLWGAGWAFALNALSFLCVVWVLVSYDEVRRASELPRHTPAREALLGSLVAPIRLATEDARVRAAFLSISAFALAAAPVPAMLPVLAKRSFGASATGYGLMLGALGGGAVLGGLLLRGGRRAVGPRAVVATAMAAYGAFSAGAALAPSLALAAALLVPAGMGWLACLATLSAQVQLAAPSWMKSRLVALYHMVFFTVWSASATLGGAVAGRFGARAAVAGAGAATVLAGLVASRLALPSREVQPESGASLPPPPLEGKRAA